MADTMNRGAALIERLSAENATLRRERDEARVELERLRELCSAVLAPLDPPDELVECHSAAACDALRAGLVREPKP